MLKLILYGIAASFLFSTTFVFNSWLSGHGGDWFWTAFLRYLYVFIIATSILFFSLRKIGGLNSLFSNLTRNALFWLLSGSIGSGVFYLLLCYASQFAAGWIVATTWQSTLLMTPVALFSLGVRVRPSHIALLAAATAGILLVDWPLIVANYSISGRALGAIILAGYCYPVGNLLVGYATNGGHRRIPMIRHWTMNSTLCRIWLMTAGALPLLCLVGLVRHPAPPSLEQLGTVLYIALSTGVAGTALFLTALHKAKDTTEIAAVTATQSLEIPFALAFEVLFFKASYPNLIQMTGVILVVVSVSAFLFLGRTAKPDTDGAHVE